MASSINSKSRRYSWYCTTCWESDKRIELDDAHNAARTHVKKNKGHIAAVVEMKKGFLKRYD